MITRIAGLLLAVMGFVSCGGQVFADDPFTTVARLSGTVCGVEMVGSAVVIRDELMLTAAHNVAGSQDPLTITFSDGTEHSGVVVGFDPHRDIAFLSTPGMHRDPVRMVNAEEGVSGEILRLSRSIDEVSIPYADAEIVTAVGHDIYDETSDVRRSNLRLDAKIGSGFSGSPVLDVDGSLAGMVNARSRDTALIYAVTTSEIRTAFAATDLETIVESTRCAP